MRVILSWCEEYFNADVYWTYRFDMPCPPWAGLSIAVMGMRAVPVENVYFRPADGVFMCDCETHSMMREFDQVKTDEILKTLDLMGLEYEIEESGN